MNWSHFMSRASLLAVAVAFIGGPARAQNEPAQPGLAQRVLNHQFASTKRELPPAAISGEDATRISEMHANGMRAAGVGVATGRVGGGVAPIGTPIGTTGQVR